MCNLSDKNLRFAPSGKKTNFFAKAAYINTNTHISRVRHRRFDFNKEHLTLCGLYG
jgi:hypothetical protein